MSEEMLRVWRMFPQTLESAVQCWHTGSGDGLELHEYLGLTWPEYQELTS